MEQYLIIIAAIVCGLLIIKKVAGCIVRLVVFAAMLAVVAFAYYYFNHNTSTEAESANTETVIDK